MSFRIKFLLERFVKVSAGEQDDVSVKKNRQLSCIISLMYKYLWQKLLNEQYKDSVTWFILWYATSYYHLSIFKTALRSLNKLAVWTVFDNLLLLQYTEAFTHRALTSSVGHQNKKLSYRRETARQCAADALFLCGSCIGIGICRSWNAQNTAESPRLSYETGSWEALMTMPGYRLPSTSN